MLLDTHVLIWLLEGDDRLGATAREALVAAHAVHVSAASLWEVAIKVELGRMQAPEDLPGLVSRSGLQHLPVTGEHAWAVRSVVLPHRDPFDRLLLAQASVEALPLVTADRTILGAAPPPRVRLVDARR